MDPRPAPAAQDFVSPDRGAPAYDFTTLVDRTAMGSSKWTVMHAAAPGGAAGEGIAPFSVADLDLPNAPEITDGLIEALQGGLVLGYTVTTPEYVEAVTGWFARRHGWTVDPEWIVLSPGIIPAFSLAIRALTASGDGVIVQTPGYYPFFDAIALNDRRVVRNPLVQHEGRFRIDFEELERQARDPRTTMLLFCSPHNPTGRVWEEGELAEVARIVVDNDLVLVSDEIHCDLALPGHRHTVAASLGEDIAQRALVLTSPSKSFNIAGMATSNVIIPSAALRERFARELLATGHQNPNILGALACQLAYTRGEAWLDALIELIAHNQQVVRDFCAERLPQVIVADLEGTYLQWLDLRGLGLSAEELARRNIEAGLFFDEGGIFGPEGEGFERLVIACPTDTLLAGLERMRRAYA